MNCLPAEAEGDVADGSRRELVFFPENFIHVQAFDTDLAGLLTHPDHARVGPLDATLQQDHVAREEVMPGRMKTGTRG